MFLYHLGVEDAGLDSAIITLITAISVITAITRITAIGVIRMRTSMARSSTGVSLGKKERSVCMCVCEGGEGGERGVWGCG